MFVSHCSFESFSLGEILGFLLFNVWVYFFISRTKPSMSSSSHFSSEMCFCPSVSKKIPNSL